MQLVETIERIQANLRKELYCNESSVREAIVIPILSDLGWPVMDPGTVAREHTIKARRVDYALFSKEGSPDILIEVKAVGHSDGADIQLFEYAFHYGVPFAVLTDGREWSFYLPQERGSYSERILYKLDLLERQSEEAANILQRYLSYDRVISGEAHEDARSDFRDATKKRQAAEAIPRAWDELVSGQDEILLQLISEQVQNMCGYAPSDSQISRFLKELTYEKHPEPKIAQRKVSRSRPGSAEEPFVPRSSSRGKERAVSYRLFEKDNRANNATEAMIEILVTLSRKQDGFFEKFAQQVKGKKRNHVARRREDVYPGRDDLLESVKPLGNGWYIGGNISNREKIEFIRKACSIVGVTFGKDVVVEW